MAPGQKRELRKDKKKNWNFTVRNKAVAVKTVQNTLTKKAKDKNVHKKKVKHNESIY